MSTTALAWIILYCIAAVGSFVNPMFGMLGYLLEYYMRPELHWWGKELPVLRWNLIISMIFGATFWLRRTSLRPMVPIRNLALPWLLALAVVMLIINITLAVNPMLSWSWSTQWVKMAIIFPLLIVGAVRTRGNFNAFIAVHMLGAFWWGWEAWINPKRIAGRLMSVGSGDTQNDNAASAHLLTVLPFIVIYLLVEKDKRLRAIALVAAPFVVNTLVLCNSRGATVGAVAALCAAMFFVRSGYRLKLAGVAVATIATFLLLADPVYLKRQQTTTNPDDRSSLQRLMTWSAATDLMKDYPLGTGGRGFHSLSAIYIPLIVQWHNGEARAPHNTYIMVTSEWGIPGLICYMGFMGSTFLMLRRVKRAAVGRLGHEFFYWRALAIQLALVGFMVAAVFTDRLYAEAPYWMAALAYALYRIQATDQAEEVGVAIAAEADDGVSSGIPVNAQPATGTC